MLGCTRSSATIRHHINRVAPGFKKMNKDQIQLIIAGASESLRLVVDQQEFQSISQICVARKGRDVVFGKADEILAGDALKKAIILLDLLYEGLDREVSEDKEKSWEELLVEAKQRNSQPNPDWMFTDDGEYLGEQHF